MTLTLNVSEPGATVERIAYGERIVLRPDPTPSDRGYEKGESPNYPLQQSWLFKFSNYCVLHGYCLRTSGSQRSLQQRPILRQTTGPLHGPPGVQPRAGIIQRKVTT